MRPLYVDVLGLVLLLIGIDPLYASCKLRIQQKSRRAAACLWMKRDRWCRIQVSYRRLQAAASRLPVVLIHITLFLLSCAVGDVPCWVSVDS